MMSGYNMKDLIEEAQFRWLSPEEVLFILQNYEETQFIHEPPKKPPSGSLFLFNKRVLRFFCKDGHSWQRKNVGERLKVANVEALNCDYAHGEENPNFQRRTYWMLDSAMEHIVLVHYREAVLPRPELYSNTLFDKEQKFSIREISPHWGYATETTKVLIIGTFTCDPSNSEWICMFGDTQVPVEIIQEGVICCYAPPHPSGIYTVSITSGNQAASSHFQYHDNKPPDRQMLRSDQQDDNNNNNNNDDERLRIVEEEVKKVRKQNVITHSLLSVLIVMTAVWQISEVSIILRLKDGVTHPFRSIGSMLKSMIKRPRSLNGNIQDDDNYTITSNLIESSPVHNLKIPKLQLPKIDLGQGSGNFL